MRPIDTRVLSDHVYLEIRDMILSGELAPGAKVDKRSLADSLAVSPTPINEAVSRLVGEKYLEQRSHQGYFVRTYTADDMRQMFEVRAGIEGIAVRLCIERTEQKILDKIAKMFDSFSLPFNARGLQRYQATDKEFHGAIIQNAGNELIREINDSFGYFMRSYQKGLVRPPEETLPEHHEITAAIKARDADLAEQLMVRHFLRSAAVGKDAQ